MRVLGKCHCSSCLFSLVVCCVDRFYFIFFKELEKKVEELTDENCDLKVTKEKLEDELNEKKRAAEGIEFVSLVTFVSVCRFALYQIISVNVFVSLSPNTCYTGETPLINHKWCVSDDLSTYLFTDQFDVEIYLYYAGKSSRGTGDYQRGL